MPPSKANIKGNIWQVFINDAEAPFNASISYRNGIDIVPVTVAISGSTPVAHIVQGHTPTLDFEWSEWEIEGIKIALGVNVAPIAGVHQLPKIGTQMPTHHVRLHDPNADDTSLDLVFPQMVFNGIDRTMDGRSSAKFKSTGIAERTAAGVTHQIGWVDPS